jgi:ABC-2 type transport system ATP-binding protein
MREAAAFRKMKVDEAEGGIELSLQKDEVPDLIKHLSDSGVRLYEVKAVNKSLEDRFLEITADKEEAQHV